MSIEKYDNIIRIIYMAGWYLYLNGLEHISKLWESLKDVD